MDTGRKRGRRQVVEEKEVKQVVLNFNIEVNKISLPDYSKSSYTNFVREEAQNYSRFIVDADNRIYITNGEGMAAEVDANIIMDMNKYGDNRLTDLVISTMWETSPKTYNNIGATKKRPLILRNEIIKKGWEIDNISELYPNIIEVRRNFKEVPLFVTPEFFLPSLYGERTANNLNYDSVSKIIYTSEGLDPNTIYGVIIRKVIKRIKEENTN